MSEERDLVIESVRSGFDASERERRMALLGLTISGATLLILAVVSIVSSASSVCALGCLSGGAMITSLAFLVIALAPGSPNLVDARLEIAGGELRILRGGGVLRRLSLGEIVQGHREDPDRVVLATRRGEAIILAPQGGEAIADRVLRAAGVSAGERVLRVPLASAASRIPGGVTFTILAFATTAFAAVLISMGSMWLLAELMRGASYGGVGPLFLALVVVALLAVLSLGLLRALLRREVVVGTDGAVFHGALRKRRVRFDDLVSARREARGVRLHRRDGSSILLPVVGARGGGAQEEARASALLRRIEEVLDARAASAVDRPGLAELDRGGRDADAWREHLRGLAREDADYRRAGLTRAELGNVIEDAAAPVGRRVGAALALAAGEPEEARRRVRIAADASADEELKRALEQAAEGEVDMALIERAEKRGS